MGKKGLSLEEKRQRMLQIFKDDPTVYHFKEIEKIAIKKGITFQSVKEVLDSLVGDDLVECDKIGSSTFYWALPSKTYQNKLTNIQKNQTSIEQIEKEISELEIKINEAIESRKDKERETKMEKLKELSQKESEIQTNLATFEKNDPVKYKNLLDDNKIYKQIIENMIDNIWTIQSWMKGRQPDANLIEMYPELEKFNIFD